MKCSQSAKYIKTDNARITSGIVGTLLHTLSGRVFAAITALMYGFRKRHGERRLKQGPLISTNKLVPIFESKYVTRKDGDPDSCAEKAERKGVK